MAPSPSSRLVLVAALALVALPAVAGCLSDDGSGASPADAEAGDPPTTGNATADRNRTGGDPGASGDDPGGNATTPNGTSPEPRGPAYPTTFSTWGCDTTFALLEVPRSWAAQQIPDGFEPITFLPAGAFVPGAPNRSVRASFLVASNHCDEVTYPGADVGPRTGVSKAYYGVFVEAPDAYEADEKVSVYPLRFVTSSQDEADLLSRWGLPAEAGSVALEAKADPGAARSWTLTASSEAAEARVDLQTAGSGSAGEAATFRFFGAADGSGALRAMDYRVEAPNSTQNVVAAGAMNAVVDLRADDAPYPAPTASPIAVTRWTPSDKAAQHASLVTFEE